MTEPALRALEPPQTAVLDKKLSEEFGELLPHAPYSPERHWRQCVACPRQHGAEAGGIPFAAPRLPEREVGGWPGKKRPAGALPAGRSLSRTSPASTSPLTLAACSRRNSGTCWPNRQERSPLLAGAVEMNLSNRPDRGHRSRHPPWGDARCAVFHPDLRQSRIAVVAWSRAHTEAGTTSRWSPTQPHTLIGSMSRVLE